MCALLLSPLWAVLVMAQLAGCGPCMLGSKMHTLCMFRVVLRADSTLCVALARGCAVDAATTDADGRVKGQGSGCTCTIAVTHTCLAYLVPAAFVTVSASHTPHLQHSCPRHTFSKPGAGQVITAAFYPRLLVQRSLPATHASQYQAYITHLIS